MILFAQGAALFAFIPLVLFLFLQLPMGPGPSLAVGMLLMLGHRLVAAPWMRRHSTRRCLWCGRERGQASRFDVAVAGGAVPMAACSERHFASAARFLAFVERFRLWIALGIFVPLLLLLAGTLALAAGHPFIPHQWNATQFRAVVAVTVVGTSVGYLAFPPSAGALTCPFPLHNLFLLGIRNILWVFRIVGGWWLARLALMAI